MRYMDPTNSERFVDREVEAYWSNGDTTVVDLYVGGVEHAVLHLLYSRFWHKVLFDLGHVQTREPFGKLFNQGMLLAAAYTDERGLYVQADQVEERDGQYFFDGKPVTREYGKMGKSLKNSIDPTEFCQEYGADTLRLYLMSIGPLEKSKPWESRQTSGVHRFLQRTWRNAFDESTGAVTVVDLDPDNETLELMHKTIAGVRYDYESLGFNTAIAKMIEFNNHLTGLDAVPRQAIETLVLLLAPLAPHFAEEVWLRLGHDHSLHTYPFPVEDPKYVVSSMVEIPVQINGKVRARVELPADADEATIRVAALNHPRIVELLAGAEPRKVVIVPGKLLSIVL
jgi:leucyl-tRNA synthetase